MTSRSKSARSARKRPSTKTPKAPAPAEPQESAEPVETRVEDALLAELPTFELFFKTFGFKRVHGRVWGLLVLSSAALPSKEISAQLGISQAATSVTLNELAEWGAVRATFDSARHCHVHAPVGNALSIVATVFRRREQVVFQQFKQAAERAQGFITEKHGIRDPRVLTLRSIITTCDIAEALMQLVLGAVQNAMSDSESVLSRAIHAALKVGVGAPTRWLFGNALAARAVEAEQSDLLAEAEDTLQPMSPPDAAPALTNGAGSEAVLPEEVPHG